MEEDDADMVCCGIGKEYEEEPGRVEKLSHEHADTYVDAAHALKLLIRASGSNSISVYPGNKIGKREVQLNNRVFLMRIYMKLKMAYFGVIILYLSEKQHF